MQGSALRRSPREVPFVEAAVTTAMPELLQPCMDNYEDLSEKI